MSDKEQSPQYPIRTLHDFLFDVQDELRRLRKVSILGIIASLTILFVLVRFTYFLANFNILGHITRRVLFFEFVFIILAIACIVYSLYTLISQHSFFKRWGNRFEQLNALEQMLLEENKK